MVQACAVKERVGSLHLDATRPPPQAILDIPVEAYFPSPEDMNILRDEFRGEIQQIIESYLPYLAENDRMEKQEKPFSVESRQKSLTVRHIYPLSKRIKSKQHTVRFRYKAINFLQNPHNRHSSTSYLSSAAAVCGSMYCSA